MVFDCSFLIDCHHDRLVESISEHFSDDAISIVNRQSSIVNTRNSI